MATLRAIEERDSKGGTIRHNPSITYRQNREIRTIVGRNDWRLDENPKYHQTITAQAQSGKIHFFYGSPDTTQSRNMAKEISVDEVTKVAPYIIDELRAHPMKIRESRPRVYELKLATVGDVEVTSVEELDADNGAITVTPVAPDINPQRSGKPRKTGSDIEVTA